ncbi:hypothetical protein Cgig2_012101 [Carnegiea gigantea]|uniref:RNase H type-1 domain-containing protein n=1 Tax=Carnegiea gigantea TaxID=171969 RepID=A0A9Q1GNR6_9CARY|nr:hypothetical protein Cgig2_012101 [Carnegiea gigantea]
MRETNTAFLTKLGWRLIVEKDKLWSQVLRAKYCNNRAKFLKQGLRAEVGNGRRTLFWYHNWVDTTPLCQHTLQEIPPHLQDNTVEEMWDASSGWKWNVFVELLSDEALKKVAVYEITQGEDNEDQLGLRIAWDAGHTKLEVMLDSQITMQKVQQPYKKHQPLHFIIKECQALVSSCEWEVKLHHCYREANRAVNHFANLGVDQNTPIVLYETPLMFALSILFEDVSGVSWPRTISIE